MLEEEEITEEWFNEPLVDEEPKEEIVTEGQNMAPEMTDRFLELFLSYSFSNITYGKLTFHVILGQLFNYDGRSIYIKLGNRNLGLRFHEYVSQDSGSGKSSATSFITSFCNSIPLNVKIVRGEVSEAALVGTFQSRRVTNPAGGQTDVTEEVPGVLRELQNGGIIIFDEASYVLKSGEKEYTKFFLNYLQTAMDEPPANLVTKRTVLGELAYSPTCSFMFLTYPVPIKTYEVLKGGFFQRTVAYFKKLRDDEWDKIKDEFIKKLKSIETKEMYTDTRFSELVNYLKSVREWGKKINYVFVDEQGKKALSIFYDKFKEMVDKHEGEKKDVLNTFRIRSLVEVLKIASHRALLDKRNNVMAEDVEYGARLVLECFISVVDFVDWAVSQTMSLESWELYWQRLKKEWFFIIKKCDAKNGMCQLSKFKEVIETFLGISPPSAYRLIEVWNKKGLIIKKANYIILR